MYAIRAVRQIILRPRVHEPHAVEFNAILPSSPAAFLPRQAFKNQYLIY